MTRQCLAYLEPGCSPRCHLTRFFVRLILLVLLLSGCGGLAGSGGQKAAGTRLKVLHLNDSHSHLQAGELMLQRGDTATSCRVGGMARVGQFLRQQTAAAEVPVLRLHAGDAVQGTLYASQFAGTADAEVLNAIGFDALTLGNHEFDGGDAWLAAFLDRLQMPVLSANLQVPADHVLAGRYAPSVVRDIAGSRVGIVGLTIADKTLASSQPGPQVRLVDELTALRAAVAQLQAAGVGRIIVLSHCGYDRMQSLAAQVPAIDLIVDGDSHSLLGDFSAWGLASAGPYPTRGRNADGDLVCIVQAWEYGKVVGEVDLLFNGDRLQACTGHSHLLLAPDEPAATLPAPARQAAGARLTPMAAAPDLARLIAGYQARLGQQLALQVGAAAQELPHRRLPAAADARLALGSRIAPLVAQAYWQQLPQADVALVNAGAVRGGLMAGPIRYEDLYTLLPFSATLVTFELSGAQLRQVLEDAVDHSLTGGSTGAFPYVYGMRFSVDASQPAGQRLGPIALQPRGAAAFEPLKAEGRYCLVTNSYLAAGRDGYRLLGQLRHQGGAQDSGHEATEAFVRWVRQCSAAGRKVEPLPAGEQGLVGWRAAPLAQGCRTRAEMPPR